MHTQHEYTSSFPLLPYIPTILLLFFLLYMSCQMD